MRLVIPDDEVTMAQGRSRPAWAEIDLDAVTHNAGVLARLAAPAELCAVVKAHGYGHGGPAVARAALAGGATRLAVALVDEGVELRQHKVTAPILLLSECGLDAVEMTIAYGLTPTLYSTESIEAYATAAGAAGGRIAVHVKVDTGMHRVGAPPEALAGLAAAVAAEPMLELESVWTHLPVADGLSEVDRAFTTGQLGLFERLVADLEGPGVAVPLRHAANTAGTIAFPEARFDIVRCGLGLYGYLPGPSMQEAFAEQPRARLAPGDVLEGTGGRGAHARRRRASFVRSPAPVPALGGRHRAHWLRRRRPEALFTGGFDVLIGGVAARWPAW